MHHSNQTSTTTETMQPIHAQNLSRTVRDAVVLIFAWAIVIFVVQEYTTSSNYPLSLGNAVGSRVVRFTLDMLACGTIVLAVRGWFIHVVVVGWAVSALTVVVYYEYYAKTLSWTTISHHFAEGLSVGGYALELIHWPSFSLIVVAAVVLVYLARRTNRGSMPRLKRLNFLMCFGIGWLLFAFVSTLQIDRLKKLKTFGSVDRLAMTHGYFLTWLGEWWYLDADALLLRATEAARIEQNRLTPLEAPVSPGGKLSIVQVESLDYDVLACEVNGQPVMPFLKGLTARSYFYRIATIHRSGSCDADFVMLMNLNPAGDVTPYTVPGFDWSPSLAARVGRNGYRSVFLHGNDRSFFNRGLAIDRMGFDRVLFREELESRFGLISKHWGVSDRVLFNTSRDLLIGQSGHVMHFIITLTSHGPFHFLDREDCELFPYASSQREHYLNSMRYVDTQLAAYVHALPPGTVIVLYGDHTSHVEYGQNRQPRGREFVPLVIHKVGANLAKLQRTRELGIATSGELTLLDAAGFVWSMFPGDASE